MRPSAFGRYFLVAGALCTSAVVQAQIGGKITQLGSGGRSFNDAKPDLALDPVTNVYAHVFEGGAKAPHQIRLKLFDAKTGGGISGGDTAMSSGTDDQVNPCVAYIAKTGMFLVAWQKHTNGTNWDIMCRAYDPKTKTSSPIVTVAATAADEITPDIAGEGTKVDDDAVVVWDDENVGIRAVEVEVPSLTAVKVLTPKTLAPGAKPANTNPSVSRSGGAPRRIAVAYERSSVLLSVQAYTMDLAAASTVSSFPRGTFPEVDGNGSEFVVVFQRQETVKPALGDIWCLSVKVPPVATQPLLPIVAPRALGATTGQDEKHPAVAFVGGSYLAAWSVVNTTDPYGKCRIQTLTPACSSCGNGWLVNYGGRQRGVDWNAVASEYNSDAATTVRRARVMYDFYENHATGPRSLVQKVNYEVVGGPKTTIVSGCGKGGSLSVPEPVAFAETITPTLSGADSTTTVSLAMVGIPTSRVTFPCGPCTYLLGVINFPVPVSGGNAQWSLPIPCDAAFNNLELDLQYVVLTLGTSPCSTLPNLSASNLLRVTIR